jgi:hypothetical protein
MQGEEDEVLLWSEGFESSPLIVLSDRVTAERIPKNRSPWNIFSETIDKPLYVSLDPVGS